MKFNHLIKHLFKLKSSKSHKKEPILYLKSPSNILNYGMTAYSIGHLNTERYFGKHIPRSPEANQIDVDALIYFERKSGKQMLADGYKFHELHPAMQTALKYGKAYLKKHE